MSEGFIDLDPGAVSSAGRNTAATSGEWSSWAGQAEGLLRDAAGGAKESVVSAAFEGYVSTWNPALQGIARQVDAMGTNAASASTVMTGADHDSAGLLGQHGSTVAGQASHLSRPITG